MKTTIKGFVHMSTNSWSRGELHLYGCDMSDCNLGAVLVKEVDFDFDMPDDFDPRPAQIKALQEKQTQAAADFHALQTDIMRQINDLQALELAA